MNKILIIQSAPDHAPEWVNECLNSVEMWAELNGFEYVHLGDELFSYAPEYSAPFTKIQRSDLARLRAMASHLSLGRYRAVYWLDADFLIWNIYEFQLPLPVPGSVVCAREVYYSQDSARVLLNNSVVGLCTAADAHTLITRTMAALDPWKDGTVTPPHTVAGPMVLMQSKFPLRRIIAKQAGCFSDVSIKRILGPWLAGRVHIWWMSLANGATLRAANLCSSRQISESVMDDLVADLIHGEDHELGSWAHAAPIYRAYLWAVALPFRVRCWLQARQREIRKTLMSSS